MLARLRSFLRLFDEKDKAGAEALLALARIGSIIAAGMVTIWAMVSFTDVKTLFLPEKMVAGSPGEHSGPTEQSVKDPAEVSPASAGPVPSLERAPLPVAVKTEPFEQRGSVSQRVCDGTIMLSVEPYADISARPDQADAFTQVTMSVDGGTPQTHDLGKTLPISARCRLTGLRVFPYAQRAFGVEGIIKIGEFE